MSKLSKINIYNHVSFMCPGCKEIHSIRCNSDTGVNWNWNQDSIKPTFSPSILVKGTKLTDKGNLDLQKWIDEGYPKVDQKFDSVNTICHSFVNDGYIQFLSDSTHELSGQTIELPDWKD